MVTKANKAGTKKRAAKLGQLKLNRETVKNLSRREEKQIKGGTIVPSKGVTCGACAKL